MGTIQRGNLFLHDAIWFTTEGGTIGIVLVFDRSQKKIKAYIGRGAGASEAIDAVRIMEYGAPFPINAAIKLFENSVRNCLNINECTLYECVVDYLSQGEQLYNHPEKDTPCH